MINFRLSYLFLLSTFLSLMDTSINIKVRKNLMFLIILPKVVKKKVSVHNYCYISRYAIAIDDDLIIVIIVFSPLSIFISIEGIKKNRYIALNLLPLPL